MKSYRYMCYDFNATNITHANTGRPLYEINGMKPAGTRPFLTSIAETKVFIREAIETGYYLDGAGRTHPVNRD